MPVSQEDLRALCNECGLEMGDEVFDVLLALTHERGCKPEGAFLFSSCFAHQRASLSSPTHPAVTHARCRSHPRHSCRGCATGIQASADLPVTRSVQCGAVRDLDDVMRYKYLLKNEM